MTWYQCWYESKDMDLDCCIYKYTWNKLSFIKMDIKGICKCDNVSIWNQRCNLSNEITVAKIVLAIAEII